MPPAAMAAALAAETIQPAFVPPKLERHPGLHDRVHRDRDGDADVAGGSQGRCRHCAQSREGERDGVHIGDAGEGRQNGDAGIAHIAC